MPVDIQTLKTIGTVPEGPREAKVKPAVLDFLKQNKENAYTVAELAEMVTPGETLNKQTVNQVVRSLEKEGLVIRREVQVEGGKSLIHIATV